MTFAEKHHHVNDFPTYPVDYVSYKSVTYEQPHKICWAGSYTGKFGQQPYVDLVPETEGTKVLRVRLPKWMQNEIDEIAHSEEDMNDIKAGRVGIILHDRKTKNGNETASVDWIDM